ncbi:Eco57I restriction-modification methylase domain-containing protein [Miniphocaeibacter massiliensis]|uniref:Eco57I restriction-modification methylase domain-containing protein n=1 Tax=Miniphocaeibacter massiliensis TaxID=2041841 RepID=UPI000C1BCC92|nr:N-6 DNA methylase [Miniphocaeibacter massiliensis]
MIIEAEKIREQLIRYTVYSFFSNNNLDHTSFKMLNLNKENELLTLEMKCEIDLKIKDMKLYDLIDELERITFHLNESVGTVYTKKYISDFIVNILEEFNEDTKIIDPGCGGGVFLVSAAEIINKKTGLSFVDIVNNNIFGIDIDINCINITNIVLEILCLMNGENTELLKTNLLLADSLKINWIQEFGVEGFDYIIGNPPYYNIHDMKDCEIDFLKTNYITCNKGVFNIFYAFIENAFNYLRNRKSKISFIIPNNIFTISSAQILRKYLTEKKSIEHVIDFTDNMLFKPVRTYNCIIKLGNTIKSNFLYTKLEKNKEIEKILENKLELEKRTIKISINNLDSHSWKLVDTTIRNNLDLIEGQQYSLKPYIRTGIATLRDNVYMVDKDFDGYYKIVGEKRYNIESGLIRKIYKVPELKKVNSLEEAERYIIFPYKFEKGVLQIIEEEEFISKYPFTYEYLLAQKNILDGRDKGKRNSVKWYAYGRTQGLKNSGKKLLFPTFSNVPKFKYDNNDSTLFCNGYAIYENNEFELEIMQKILNSSVMDYYIKNTSYPIEGGYFCYQKKYIQNFTIPFLSEAEVNKIKELTGKELDEYIQSIYSINL